MLLVFHQACRKCQSYSVRVYFSLISSAGGNSGWRPSSVYLSIWPSTPLHLGSPCCAVSGLSLKLLLLHEGKLAWATAGPDSPHLQPPGSLPRWENMGLSSTQCDRLLTFSVKYLLKRSLLPSRNPGQGTSCFSSRFWEATGYKQECSLGRALPWAVHSPIVRVMVMGTQGRWRERFALAVGNKVMNCP